VPYKTFDRQPVEMTIPILNQSSYDPVSFVRKMLRHNVFAAYERLVAGKICQIVLSGNYSPSNIELSKQVIIRVKDTIRQVFEKRIKAHKEGLQDYEHRIIQCNLGTDYDASNLTLEDLKHLLSQQLRTVTEFEGQLDRLLDAKLESFDFLSRLANKEEIEVYLINGAIVINEKEVQAIPRQQDGSYDGHTPNMK